jgi:hypothetical protein
MSNFRIFVDKLGLNETYEGFEHLWGRFKDKRLERKRSSALVEGTSLNLLIRVLE